MTVRTNCPNCGAPVDLDEKCCPYCETPYTWKTGVYTPQEDVMAVMADVNRRMAAGIMTPNEARALLGLPSI